MEVETPIGVIGIRGTTVGVQIATIGGRTSIANLTNPDTGGTGSFTFSNDAGQALFSLAIHFLEVRSATTDPGVPSISSGQDVLAFFGPALNTAIQIQRPIRQRQNDEEPGEQDPTSDQEGQLEGDPLQAVQDANLTQEQIDALLSEAPIETAAGPQTGSGDRPQSGGSSFASGLQPPSAANPIEIFNSNVENQIQGSAGGTGVLNIEIAVDGGDSLVVNGITEFAGAIFVSFLGGHIPTAGDVLDFIIAQDIIDGGVQIGGVNYFGGLLGIQLAEGTARFVAVNGGGDSFVDPYEIIVGENSAGSPFIDAGQAIASRYLSVGEEASGNGTFVPTNGSFLSIEGASFIGNAGSGEPQSAAEPRPTSKTRPARVW